jgi:uncharacterized protein YcbK (DUF882 family)
MNKKDYLGLDGFVWWIGVVEDRNDPAKIGRCKVRIFGWHSPDLTEIPTADLPWAHPMLPVNNDAHFAPKEGEYVCGFFLDGEYGQNPVIMGVLPGITPGEVNYSFGFSDQRQDLSRSPRKVKKRTYKKDGTGVEIENEDPKKYPEYPEEPSSSRFTRNENIGETLLSDRKKNLVEVPIAGGGSWKEPPPAYNAEYPHNKATETESGHVIEIDDTPDWERIHIAHRTGTFQEMYPSGTKVEKVVKNNYQIIMGDDNIYVMGQVNITVDGAAKIKVKGDAQIQSDCSIDLTAKKDIKLNAKGSLKLSGTQVSISSLAATRVNGGFLLDVDAPIVLVGKSGLAISDDFLPSPSAGGGGGGGGEETVVDGAAAATNAAGEAAGDVSKLSEALGGVSKLANIPGLEMITELPALSEIESLTNGLTDIADISSQLGDLNEITADLGQLSKLTEITDQLENVEELKEVTSQLEKVKEVSNTLKDATKLKNATDQLKKVSDATKQLKKVNDLGKLLDKVNEFSSLPLISEKVPKLSKAITVLDELNNLNNNAENIQTLAAAPSTQKILEISEKINELPTDLSQISGFDAGLKGLTGFSEGLTKVGSDIESISKLTKDIGNFQELAPLSKGFENLDKNLGELKGLTGKLSGAALDAGNIPDITKGLTNPADIIKFSNFENQLAPLSEGLSGITDGTTLAAGIINAGAKCGNPSAGFIEPTPTDISGFYFDAGERGATEFIQKQINNGVYNANELKDIATTESDLTPPKLVAPTSTQSSINENETQFDDNMMISKYFTLGDVSSKAVAIKQAVVSQRGLSKGKIVGNLQLLAQNCLDPIKEKYPNLTITNAFRKPQGTAAGRSQHEIGQAADLQFSGVSKQDYYDIVLWIRDNVPHDQLLLEYKTFGTGLPWVHISFNPEGNRSASLANLKNATFNNHRLYRKGYHRLA